MVERPPFKACKGCTERTPGCHDRCERHKAELAELQRRKAYLKMYTDRYKKSGVVYASAVIAHIRKQMKQRRK